MTSDATTSSRAPIGALRISTIAMAGVIVAVSVPSAAGAYAMATQVGDVPTTGGNTSFLDVPQNTVAHTTGGAVSVATDDRTASYDSVTATDADVTIS